MKDLLEDRDVAAMVCSFLRVKEILSVRATCKAGRANSADAFCPKEAWKRVLRVVSTTSWIKSCRRNDYMMRSFARDGHFDLLQWARSSKVRPAYWTCMVTADAAKRGDLEMIKWMRNEADPPIAPGNMYCPEGWIATDGCTLLYPTKGIECAAAARGGQLETLQWLRAQDPPFPWTNRTFENAIESGHLHVLKWAQAQERPCPTGRVLSIVVGKIRNARNMFELTTRRARLRNIVTGHEDGDNVDTTKLLKKHMPIIEWLYPQMNTYGQERIREELAELNIVLQ